jgi:hypothetical protein
MTIEIELGVLALEKKAFFEGLILLSWHDHRNERCDDAFSARVARHVQPPYNSVDFLEYTRCAAEHVMDGAVLPKGEDHCYRRS